MASNIDFWERMSLAADRAEDMAKAERVMARVRRFHTEAPPLYIDEDGPEIVSSASLGQWIGWPARAPGMGRGQ